MKLQNGRPADTTGRLEKELRCYDLLDRLGVPYERVDHAPAMTMEVCQEIDRVLNAVICKNLFLCNRQETAFYLLIDIQMQVQLNTLLLRQYRLVAVEAEQMQQLADITLGSVSVLGLMNDTATRCSCSSMRMCWPASMWAATPVSTPAACACAPVTWWRRSCLR